ncbi:MAG: hypothetical protein LBJ88_05320 [Campylobacteraceae bacterium]|jgi:hypothetical protein|nr:hypothetical protein [Campylobacteraceae bacterium]
MKHLLKLSFIALVVLFFTGCGGGSSGSSAYQAAETDDISLFMSDFPTLGTSGFTPNYEYKSVNYYDNSSADLAIAVNATLVNEKDFNITYEYYVDIDNFYYGYELNSPSAKDLEYAGASASASYGSSSASIYLEANRTISNGEFTDIFGEIDADLLHEVSIESEYEGDMSAKFAEYYAEITKIGGFFDIAGDASYIYCNMYSHTSDARWGCDKDLEGGQYSFTLYVDKTSSISTVEFYKYLNY